jgi:tyrosine-protein kinase Etk/Wzc
MTEPSNLPDNQRTGDDDEIRLLDLLIVLAKHKKLVVGLPVLAAAFSVIFALWLPKIYTASTKILPPQQSQSASAAMLAQLGGLGGLLSAGGVRNSNDLYVAMLKSRTVADGLIRRFDLKRAYEQESQSSTREILVSRSNFTISPKDGLITVEVDDEDPKRAADLANAYVDELFKFTSEIALTEASQRRLFFERQLGQAKDNLAKAEASARGALEHGGLVKVDDQGRAMVETTARLRAQIAAKEVQIGAMRTFAAEGNPDLKMALQELEVLKRETAKIEGAGGANLAGNPSDAKGIETLHLLRDMKYNETLFELLAKQYELAKIDEAKDPALIQIIEKAIEPERRSRPKRTQIVLLAIFAAIFVGVLLAFLGEAIQRTLSDPQQVERLKAIRAYLSWP